MFLEILLQEGGIPFINLLYRNLFVSTTPYNQEVLLCQVSPVELDNQFPTVRHILYNTFTLPWYFHLTKHKCHTPTLALILPVTYRHIHLVFYH